MNFVRRHWKKTLISIGAIVFFFNFPDMMKPIVASFFIMAFFGVIIGSSGMREEYKKLLLFFIGVYCSIAILGSFFLDWDIG